ncbi:MAG: YbaK/EbsC family protein [Candidatus Dormibacteraceae bacterium]
MPELPPRAQIVQEHLARSGCDAMIRVLPGSTRTAADAARELGCPVGAIASSLVFLAGGTPLLVMTSGRHRVDTLFLADRLGIGRVERASAEQVRAVTGQAIGGVAPLGHPRPISTVVDASLSEFDPLWSAAGTPHAVFPVSFTDLVRMTSGRVLPVTTESTAG